MPAARMYAGALLLVIATASCASSGNDRMSSGDAGDLDAADLDAAANDVMQDPMAPESSPDVRRTGLDQRPHNATCIAPQAPESMPMHLGDTGCFDPRDLHMPAAGLIPYAVNVPLWSDGAGKERYLALPDGSKIAVASDGDFDLPTGTVLLKTFSLGDLNVETRLFVRHTSSMWAGYSYAWNEDGTDAILVGPDAVYRTVKGQEWQFPSRQHCLDCHTQSAGFSLGLEMAQVDRDVAYPNGRTANQLATWKTIDLFDEAPPTDAAAMPSPDDERAPIEDRARAYLHANCANCHRPGGVMEPNVAIDFRFTIPLEGTRICNEPPRRTDLGIPDVKLVAPGDAEKSMISIRMHNLVPSLRMPPVASSVVDTEGVGLLDSWIRAISSCP